jgi:beta-glucanase (GH16 family)
MTSYPYQGEAARTLYPNDEAEYYSDPSVGENPFSLSDGVLSINATPAATGSNPYNLPYDSGLITTDTSFSQTYGYFEIRAELPSGKGLWPAFWMLPASNEYTSELDIFEMLGQDPSTVYSSVHGSNAGVWSTNTQTLNVPDTSAGFHTYGVDWEPTTTTFYMDGVEIASVPTPASMDSPMFMLLNLAVGGTGSWPGVPNAATNFPASMQIDYVRAYATAGTTFVGGSAAIAVPTPAQADLPVVLGSGPDRLALTISEDALDRGAEFTISVDGQQVGGTQTVSASYAAGQSQIFEVMGDFASGTNIVSINFLNDADGATPTTDGNLYLIGATMNGTAVPGASFALTSQGAKSLFFQVPASTAANPAAVPATVILGSGPDDLALSVAETAFGGNAQFTIAVDGKQVGGVQTATASNRAGSSQAFNVEGSFGPGQHTVSVNFLNDLYEGSPSLDRNLYVTGASIDGAAINGSALVLTSDGAKSFSFQEPATTPDTLTLGMSEDAWLGNAEFTVSVDGKQTGGVMTTAALHSQGAVQDITLAGNWGSGAHTVGISFINDAYGGSPTTDRNLFVDTVAYNGVSALGAPLGLGTNGTVNVAVSPGADPAPGVVTLHLAEDAYRGNAQFSVSVDGTQLGGIQSVSALNGNGGSQAFSFQDALAAGSHDVAVTFLNDLYGGTATTDRNLYVKGVDFNATPVAGATATLLATGTTHFALVVPSS